MYSVRTVDFGKKDYDDMKKAKGTKKYVLKRQIKFEDYLYCLNEDETIVKDQNSFRSKLHNVFTIRQTKSALSPFDDKRCILPNNIETLAHGHYKLKTVSIKKNGQIIKRKVDKITEN